MIKAIRPFFRWEAALTLFLFIELMVFSFINPDFLNLTNLLFSMNDYVYIGLAAIPMTFVIITGGIDVSVGSVMGLTSIMCGVLWMGGLNIWLAMLVALLISILAGMINGLVVALTGVHPLVVTLGTMFLFSGIALVISGSASASGYEGISGFPDIFVQLSNGLLFGIPHSLYLLIISMVLFSFLLRFTRFGRQVFLVGINTKAAKYSGIRTRRVLVSVYMLAGLGGGLGGVILTSYFSSARSDLGEEAILPVITAVVLGGTSIFGGKGSVLGTAIASVVIGMMQYGLVLTGFSSQETSVVIGFMLIFAVLLRQIDWRKMKGLFGGRPRGGFLSGDVFQKNRG